LKDHPNWKDEELITYIDAATILGYTHPGSISQAVRNGTLVALPYDHSGKVKPCIPKGLVLAVTEVLAKNGRATVSPPKLLEWKHRLWTEVHELNKIGINGTPIYHQTGPYKPL